MTQQSSIDPASRTGAQVMCEALVREDVEVMFGIPGGAIMPFYHAMWEYRERLRHVLCRHEQGAGHAAEGSGRVGVCIGTSGPGATNLVTPIADASFPTSRMGPSPATGLPRTRPDVPTSMAHGSGTSITRSSRSAWNCDA